jgi:hypothetical protein
MTLRHLAGNHPRHWGLGGGGVYTPWNFIAKDNHHLQSHQGMTRKPGCNTSPPWLATALPAPRSLPCTHMRPTHSLLR